MTTAERAAAADMHDFNFHLGCRHTYGGFTAPFDFPGADLSRHVYVIGKTGMGKSTLLQSFIAGLIENGHGVGVLDPHGDLAEWVLNVVPQHRLDDVVYLDPSDEHFAPALNLVSDSIPLESRPRVASALLSAFRHIWSESWGPRLEYILYHALRVLLDCQNVSLIALPRLLTDSTFRKWAVRQCRDPFIRAFWDQEFESWEKRFRAEAIAPIQNKLGQLASIPALRHALGQVRMKTDFHDVLDQGRILVVNLAKGKLGDDASRLLGALLTSALSAAAMERASLPVKDRKDFVLIVDEAHCFLSDALATILSESRKFGLCLVMAHQFIDQLSPSVRDAVLGNAGSIFAFRVSGNDAETLAANFGHSLSPSLFVELPPFTTLLRPVDGAMLPLRINLMPPDVPKLGYRDSIIARSRQKFCMARAQVEDRLNSWLNRP